jgi:hypothetical protein
LRPFGDRTERRLAPIDRPNERTHFARAGEKCVVGGAVAGRLGWPMLVVHDPIVAARAERAR